VAAQVLVELGAGQDRVRQVVVQLLGGAAGGVPPEQVAGGMPRLVQGAASAMVAGGPGAYLELEPADLVRVVPLAREIYRGGDIRLVLISLEIWSGWLDLRYVLLPQEQPGPQHVVDLDWRVADDVGTSYELMGEASGGGRMLRICQLGFRPAPPEGARTLTLTVTRDEATATLAVVEIELRPAG
jgi:hypothetical protein